MHVRAPTRARRAQVCNFEIDSKPPTYLGVRFCMEWSELTIHGHITLINGRCGPLSDQEILRFHQQVTELFEQDIMLAHTPSKPIMKDDCVRRSTFPGPRRPSCEVALIAMLMRC